MPNNLHLNTSNDWTAAANWSTGAAPVDNDSVLILTGSSFDLTGNLDQRSVADIDIPLLKIGGTFSKSIHNGLTSPLMLDDVTRLEVETAGPSDQIIILDLDGCTNAAVRRTGANPMALYLYDGTYTNLYISSGNVMLGAGLTISGELRITSEQDGRPPPTVRILSGCAITGEIVQDAGVVLNQAAIAASRTRLCGTARWRHYGGSTVNITNTVFLSGTSRLDVETTAATTIGKIDATDDAVVESRNTNFVITYTASIVQGRSIIFPKQNVDVFTAAPILAGGSTPGVAGTIQIPGK